MTLALITLAYAPRRKTRPMTTPSLNAAIGKALGVTPAREWRVKMPNGSCWPAANERKARTEAMTVGGEAVLVECWPPYDSCRDAAFELGEELKRRGLGARYADEVADLLFGPHERAAREWSDLWLKMLQVTPAQRARAAARVLGVEVKDG